jgi:hypothetical protein
LAHLATPTPIITTRMQSLYYPYSFTFLVDWRCLYCLSYVLDHFLPQPSMSYTGRHSSHIYSLQLRPIIVLTTMLQIKDLQIASTMANGMTSCWRVSEFLRGDSEPLKNGDHGGLSVKECETHRGILALIRRKRHVKALMSDGLSPRGRHDRAPERDRDEILGINENETRFCGNATKRYPFRVFGCPCLIAR